jgi:acetylornithine deacetylase/succinyl-diaminopimelate desuccinylase-like protein
MVYAERQGAVGAPTVLIYGHYDVQPPDPLSAWTTPPFEPDLRNGRIYARGAQDNKGQVFYAVKALESLIAARALHATVKILIEGEEESGGQTIMAEMPQLHDLLRADILMVHDTSTVATGDPTIVMGLRGIATLTVQVDGPAFDLHSGIHGGVAPNPATALARMIASLHDSQGRIAIPGYYDGVEKASERERTLANAIPFDPAAYESDVGVPPSGGEAGFSATERAGFRPTIDVNGIHSGYGGSGSKTIIPASAMAKLSTRVVAGQNPAACLEAVVVHLRGQLPAGLRVSFHDRSACGPGFRLDLNAESIARAKAVLEEITCRSVAFLWEGASIPVVTELARTAGAEPLLVGFGSEEDRIHAPDESFSIERFHLGFLYVGCFLAGLSAEPPPAPPQATGR